MYADFRRFSRNPELSSRFGFGSESTEWRFEVVHTQPIPKITKLFIPVGYKGECDEHIN